MGLALAVVDQLDSVGDWGLLATAADLSVTRWNRWLEQRTGLAAAEVLGRPLFEVFPELVSRRLDRYYHQALAGQTVLLSQRLHGYLLPIPLPADGAAPGRMQQSARIVPVVDGPSVWGTLTVIEDVTERVAYEAELRARARQQAAVAALARRALAGGDLAGVAGEAVTHLRETLGADFAEVLELRPDGQAWAPLAGPGWAGATAAGPAPRILPALQSDTPIAVDPTADPRFAADAELRAQGVTGGLVVRVPGRDHRPFGVLGVYTRSRRRFPPAEVQFAQALADVLGVAAERKRLEGELRLRADELAEMDRRKDEFLAMLGHELRNPLAPVRNALQVLRTKYTDDPLIVRMGEMMSRQLGHMGRLVDDLLDVARITRRKVELRKERVELAATVARALEAAQPVIEARRHELLTSLPAEPVYLDADPVRLTQVLENLLNNAATYTDEGGRIWLTAGRDGDQAVVGVRDTGVGIPRDMLPRVFDLFTQVSGSLDRSQGGLGLGLTLVRSLVEMHGGTVTASSGGLGMGSEFVVRLPVAPPSPAGTGPAPKAPRPRAAAPPHRVLIVDDNVDSAESLAILLSLWGHQAWTAHDGSSAIQASEQHRPGVVLLDIGLPRMDGYEVARRLRQEPGRDAVTLIAMTGYGQEEDRRRSREAGFDYHLIKPVDPEELAGLLTELRPGSAREKQPSR